VGNDPTTDDGSNWARIGAEAPVLVLKPEPVSPPDGETEIGETPTLDGGTYYSLYGKTHAISRFQVATDAAFTSIVYDSGEIAGTETHTVPAGNLVESTNYYWRVYYEDEDGVESEFSDSFEFTTTDSFTFYKEANIGMVSDGGYYAGNIVSDVDGQTYAIIVSDGGGDTDRTGTGALQWRSDGQGGLSEAFTLSDGKSVMDYIVANQTISDFPPVDFIQTNLNDVNYNGYNDWYFPARDELELVYRFFKPTTVDSSTSTRRGSGFGGDGEIYGTNNSSVPNRAGYAPSDPSQTSVASFQVGGADHLTDVQYWCSTAETTRFWVQLFNSGTQRVRDAFYNSYHVRAVRRVLIAP